MYHLGWENWARLIIWLAIGLDVYFFYSIWKSKVQKLEGGRGPIASGSGHLGGILLLVAGPIALGLTNNDPTNPTFISLAVAALAIIAAALSFSRKPAPAMILGWIFVFVTGVFALTGLMTNPFPNSILVFLLRGGAACVLAHFALWKLRCLAPAP
jgi:hypothetical protein